MDPLVAMGKNAGILPRCCGNVRRVKVGLQDQAMLSLARTSGELDICSQKNTSSVSISLLVRETREEQELTHCSDCKQLPCSLVKVSQHDVHNKSLAKPGIRMPDNGKQECSSCLERRP